MKVTVPLPLPNKANTYEIHFNRQLWQVIQPYVRDLKKYIKKPLYWIAPSETVKKVEHDLGFFALRSMSEDTEGPVRLDIWISDKLDWDAVKVISDGIQKSGRIKNDKLIKIGTVTKVPMPNNLFIFDLQPITEEEWTQKVSEILPFWKE